MVEWNLIFDIYAEQLREIQWLDSLAAESDDPHIIAPSDEPRFLNHEFWSQRTHEIETLALQTLTNKDIDRIFDDVAAVMDQDLARFDPIIEYFGRFFKNPAGASIRMDYETEMAHSVKRDLAWIAVERVIDRPGFFSALLKWYRIGRWPCEWRGGYPDGHVMCL